MKTLQDKILRTAAIAVATSAAFPIAARAVEQSSIDTPEKVIDAINKFAGWFYGALAALAVVFIIYAGFLFLTAGDDAEKVGKAKKQLIYAVVAVAVAILATGIVELTKVLLE